MLERSRVLRRLNAALRLGNVLITAPAGYGKSVLLRAFTAHRPHTHYIPLTSADADLSRLSERVSEFLGGKNTVILDDIHHLAGSLETLEWLTEQLREVRVAFVLSGRWNPLDRRSEMQAAEFTTHFTTKDLAFTLSESQALLSGKQKPGSAHVRAWYERTHGWPIALGLLAHQTEQQMALETTQTELFAHLAHTFLSGLSPELRRYMQVTAAPLRFSDELAAVLLGSREKATLFRQEVQKRNLFLESAGESGWFRYHELIREFWLQTTTESLTPLFERSIAWFQERGDIEMAIEHALAGGLLDLAASLMQELPDTFVQETGRIRTYQRWVESLGPAQQVAHPQLLAALGWNLQVFGRREEGWSYLDKSLHLAEAGADPVALNWVRLCVGRAYQYEGGYDKAIAYCELILRDSASDEQIRMRAHFVLGLIWLRLARFQKARNAYTEALSIAEQLGYEEGQARIRQNLAVYALIPLGEFEAGCRLLEANVGYTRGQGLNEQIIYLWGWCELHRAMGNWQALGETLAQVRDLFEQIETSATGDEFWWWWYEGMRATGQGEHEQAQEALDQAAARTENRAETLACLTWAQAWLLRRRGRLQEAIELAEQTLAQPLESPLYRAILALERDTAIDLELPIWDLGFISYEQELQPNTKYEIRNTKDLHSETKHLIAMRARSHLVQLRALLALRSWRQGDPRWRRHVRSALRALQRPTYEHLLIRYDPDLGKRFWALLLVENVAPERAQSALQQIGDPEAVLPLLGHPDPTVRIRAAQVLASIGREEAILGLAQALEREKDPEAAPVLERALQQLESQTPQPLRVQLMGDFAVWRGEEVIPSAAWPRPIVRRLFQYFALHRGKPLSRDRILEDLWPDMHPKKAWANFRTVYSGLRRILEPHLRAKTPSRYFAVEGQVYRFDPHDVVHVDMEAFETLLSKTLREAEDYDVLPLSDAFLQTLEGWAPLVPELPFAEWLLVPRERSETYYVEGCVYGARALLSRERYAEAAYWAERSITVAPWLEAGYEMLMRAYARQEQPTHALKVYNDAVAALERELGVEPSELLQWLAERLRRGEEI